MGDVRSSPVGAHDNTQAATAQDQYLVHHDPFVYFSESPAGKSTKPRQSAEVSGFGA